MNQTILHLAFMAALLAPCILLAQDERPVPREIDSAESHLEVYYVPKELLTGVPEKDHFWAMNLYLPKNGKSDNPFIMLVHGGGYGGGDKDGRGKQQPYHDFVVAANERGYAVGTMNYPLRPASIFPQVFRDFKTAMRFMRKHADTYRVDPTRFGAVGFSAGGWLISSTNFCDADYVCKNEGRLVRLSELADNDWQYPQRKLKRPAVMLPLVEEDTPYAEYSAVVNAISFDFAQNTEEISPGDPAVNVWRGMDYTPKFDEVAKAAGVDYSFATLTEERYRGKKVHVPKLPSPTRPVNGQGEDVTLQERILQFFDEQFVTNPRTPSPEIRPFVRVFEKTAKIEIVVPGKAKIHVTTDGSEPTEESPVYTGPIAVTKDTVVKALAVSPDKRNSQPVTATFYQHQPPPQITAPLTDQLPPGKVGQPYEVQFKASTSGPHFWQVSGDLGEHIPFRQKELVNPNNMKIDATTGKLAGTPDTPGVYWVQIQVAPDVGRLGTSRNYIWRVKP